MGTKRVGLARMEALMENLKRTLTMGTATMSLASLTTTTAANGDFKVDASGHKTGVVGITHSAGISAATGNDFLSGAMLVPAHCVITDIGAVVITQITQGSSGKIGFKAGDSADTADLVTEDDDALHAGSATLAPGKGVSLIGTTRVALGGAATPVAAANTAYAAGAREVHATITTQHTISAGKVRFWVKYIHVEG